MKKELYIPLIIIALTLVFGIICLMVYLSDGNSYWIKKKLKIGALLLTFNGIVYGTSGQGGSCYLAPETIPKNSLYGVSCFYSNVNQINPSLNSQEFDKEVYLFGGLSNGYSIGFNYEYEIGDSEVSLSSIICNLQYDNKSGNLNQNVSLNPFLDPEKGIMYEFSRIEIEYSFSFITTEILYKQNFFHDVPIGIIVGPYFSIPIELNAQEKLYKGINVQDSINSTFDEMRVIYNNKIKDAKPVDIGMVIGIQYEVIVIRDLKIVPSINYKQSLSGIQNNSNWKISSMDFGISIRYRF